MAIAYRASVGLFLTTNSQYVSRPVPIPTGTQVGDLLILMVVATDTSAGTIPGWSYDGSALPGDSPAAAFGQTAWHKIATASDIGGSVTVPANGTGTPQSMVVIIAAYSGATIKTVTPVEWAGGFGGGVYAKTGSPVVEQLPALSTLVATDVAVLTAAALIGGTAPGTPLLIDAATPASQRIGTSASNVKIQHLLADTKTLGPWNVDSPTAGGKGQQISGMNGFEVVLTPAAPPPPPPPTSSTQSWPRGDLGPVPVAPAPAWRLVESGYPAGLTYASVVAINGKIYAAGGHISDVAQSATYEWSGSKWVSKAPMPAARASSTYGVIGGKLYVAGGSTSSTPTSVTQDLFCYDPVANTWTSLAPAPAGLGLADRGTDAQGKLMVFREDGAVYVYDPGTDSWAAGSDVPVRVARSSAAYLNGWVMLTGGYDSMTGSVMPNIPGERLSDSAWITFTGPDYEALSSPAVIGLPTTDGSIGILHIMGSWDSAAGTRYQMYDFDNDMTTQGPPIPTDVGGPRAVLIGSEIHLVGPSGKHYAIKLNPSPSGQFWPR